MWFSSPTEAVQQSIKITIRVLKISEEAWKLYFNVLSVHESEESQSV